MTEKKLPDEVYEALSGKPPLKIYTDVKFVYGETPSHPSLRDITNGAIERCAQVADNYRGTTGWAVEDRVGIAAAIRALKGKP